MSGLILDGAFRLPTRAVAKPWGRTSLPAPFSAPGGEKIGEIWFEPGGGQDGLLAKYIFTSEHLSVQVHPSDAQTQAAGLGDQGKEECWLILDAEPGATIAVGFAEDVDPDQLRTAAVDGSIESMLAWHPVHAGDFFYIPANTVHAIGAGISLVEVQQNSDITYRLYDYGRPRELHLDDGMAVAAPKAYCPSFRRRAGIGQTQTLVDGPLFRLDELYGAPDAARLAAHAGNFSLILPLEGEVFVGGGRIAAGECVVAPLRAADFSRATRCLVAQDRQVSRDRLTAAA